MDSTVVPKFCANLSFLFADLPFSERFSTAAEAGFGGVEYLSPYEFDAVTIAECLHAHQLKQVLFNFPAGNWANGERGLACLPNRQTEFHASVDRALEYAKALACNTLHCMAGISPKGEPEAQTRSRYVANLRYCAQRCEAAGVTVTIEPINSRIDMPGYWLDSVDKALDLLAEIDRPNVKLQLDLYHAHIIGADIAMILKAHLADIAHIQVADFPGRHEPGSGEMCYPDLFALIDHSGYSGWVGCEYRPQTTTQAGLEWIRQYL